MLSHQCPGDSQTLTLAAGKVTPALLDLFLQTICLSFHDLLCLCNGEGFPQFFLRSIFFPPEEIFPDRPPEQDRFLHDNTHHITQLLLAVSSDISAADAHLTPCRVIKTGNEMHQ